MAGSEQGTPRIAVVMGVSGCGKTTIGRLLAERMGVPFADADAFHPQANIDKMAAGHPLTDEDRLPWLQKIGSWLHDHRGSGAVATCSALKRSYRDILREGAPDVAMCHLDGPMQVAYVRVQSRMDHFMPASLMQSQYDTLQPLQPDERGITVDFTLPEGEIVTTLMAYLQGEPISAPKED